jgi:DnaK suppressor protein
MIRMEANKKTRRAFNSEELDAIKSHLIEEREELWKEILDDLERDEVEEHREVIDTLKDNGDMALEELRESTAFSLIELKHNELTMIEEALGRIDKGEYGRCLDCQEWIAPARLEVFPFAVRCRDCQAKHEKRESGS